MSIHIIYWSATGNTEAMANALASSAKNLGADVKIYPVHEANIAELEKVNAIALGCPAMGSEVLEETEMEPFVESLKHFNWAGKLKCQITALPLLQMASYPITTLTKALLRPLRLWHKN